MRTRKFGLGRRACWGLVLGIVAGLLAQGQAALIGADSAGTTASGGLTVASDPVGAAVYVDGRYVGVTPTRVAELPAGDHRVRLVKEGYLENGRIVKVSASRMESLQVRLTARAQGAPAAKKAPALRIVVLAGEDSVNIISQKTAVAPLVEVRDENDLPVSGAAVLFLLRGGNRTTFKNVLRLVSVTTDG
jgi:hypothetical protein